MEKVFFTTALAWLLPGAGHFALRRWWQGALLLAASLLLFIFGWRLGGLYYPGAAADFWIMNWLQWFSGMGNGIFFLMNLLFKESTNSEAALSAVRSATFEYGGRCLALAGLLNYLAILDVFDICLRRKS